MGGGTVQYDSFCIFFYGLSPRGRGNLDYSSSSQLSLGSIPAWAGEPRLFILIPALFRVYPRVGGGTAVMPIPSGSTEGLSPRGRGNPILSGSTGTYWGSIPAWAGEPGSRSILMRSTGVYPRVGGGTGVPFHPDEEYWGLSPRGRGNPTVSTPSPFFLGSIPAWAGEPALAMAARIILTVYPRVGGGTHSVLV